jgi:hypothetical protein
VVEKRTISQRDFSLGVILPEFIDGDDLDMRAQSLKDAANLRVTNARSLAGRPHTRQRANANDAWVFNEFQVHIGGVDSRFVTVMKPNALEVWGNDYSVAATFSTVPWAADPSAIWVAPFTNAMVFGGNGFYVLTVDESGVWSFGLLDFADFAGSEKALPFWSFQKGVSIEPSDYTGSVTVTASAALFSANWVGDRIRYAAQELVITAYTSATEVTATVTTELPPSFEFAFLTSAELSGFRVGQVISSSETNWSGIIVSIVGLVVTAVTLDRDPSAPEASAATSGGGALGSASSSSYGGPDASEEIIGPNAAVSPDTVTRASAPAATEVWDEQLWSDRRGWPQSGASVNNRLAVCNFPRIPNLVAISSAREFNDFGTGLADDDAIIRQGGNNNARFLHVVPALDLIILADRGCYYVKTRDGEVLTPSNFQIIQFSERGSSKVKPSLVESSVVFSERSRNAVSACVLDGNVYLNWSVVDISQFHGHLINDPIAICGPVETSDFNERYVLIANSPTASVSGEAPVTTIASMSWHSAFGANQAGFIPWTISGQVLSVFPLFDQYHALVKRGSDAAGYRTTLEAFDPDTYLDGSVDRVGDMTTGGALAHLPAGPATLWSGRKSETVMVDESGNLAVAPTLTGGHIGLFSEAFAEPWPREMIESERYGSLRARIIRVFVSVRNTVAFKFRRNQTVSEMPSYRPQDNTAEAPPLKTDRLRFTIYGNRTHPEMRVYLDAPNPVEITEIIQEVQA